MFAQIFASSACTGVVCTIGASKTPNSSADDLARAGADAADDARQRVDLLQEAPGGDALGRVRHEHLLADLESRGAWRGSRPRTRSCPGATVERRISECPGASTPEQVVERRADVAHVDLDVREGGRAERDHDVARAAAASATRSDSVRRPLACTRSSSSCAPVSANGIRPVAHGVRGARGRCRSRSPAGRGRRSDSASGRPTRPRPTTATSAVLLRGGHRSQEVSGGRRRAALGQRERVVRRYWRAKPATKRGL